MNGLERTCLLAVFGFGLMVSVAFGQGEHTGAQCLSNQNCKDSCLAGGGLDHEDCEGSPGGVMCRVSGGGNEQSISFKVCVGGKSGQCCHFASPQTVKVDCGKTKIWNCGCVNGDQNCGFTDCGCDSDEDPDGSENTKASQSCTDC